MFSAICWSSRLWYILVCSLSMRLLAGVASRMDFITICRNSASNCFGNKL